MIFDTEPKTWSELQDYIGIMFSECGFETEVSKVVKLVRGNKEIDVYAKDITNEYEPIILTECKFWSKPIKQETIHSFRTVVDDFGANLGFIVSKNGFQSGCFEAVKNTNIRLVSFMELETQYYPRWKQFMVNKYMPYSDRLFPYWDYAGKMPLDGGKIDFDKQQLIRSAYSPICSLSPFDMLKKDFVRNYPLTVPIINDKLEQVDEEIINSDREYFDFVEKNKDQSLRHFKILYRE